jgi:hypothetical protein
MDAPFPRRARGKAEFCRLTAGHRHQARSHQAVARRSRARGAGLRAEAHLHGSACRGEAFAMSRHGGSARPRSSGHGGNPAAARPSARLARRAGRHVERARSGARRVHRRRARRPRRSRAEDSRSRPAVAGGGISRRDRRARRPAVRADRAVGGQPRRRSGAGRGARHRQQRDRQRCSRSKRSCRRRGFTTGRSRSCS